MAHAWRRHERRWKDQRYVYAVVSRRSRGVSIGLNLVPGKACNFDCVYCQVNRAEAAAVPKVDPERLREELDAILQAEASGSLYTEEPFRALAPDERGVRDIAFSGDGEPTAYAHFNEAVRIAAQARIRFGLQATKLVLITNAAYLDRASVREALAIMDANNGEIWAKLDAGTEEYFRKVNRARLTLDRILSNIGDAARVRPLVIQSLWFRLRGEMPPAEEIAAYGDRLQHLIASGAKLKAVQLYTIARNPAEATVSALAGEELDQIASALKARLCVPVEVYP